MKKLIENIIVNPSNPLRAVRLLVVLLGVIGVLLSCAPAEESGGGGVSISPNFSASDVSVTFGTETETGSVEIDTTDPSSPTLVISGLTNGNDNPVKARGVITITERPDAFTTSATRIDFDDADGFRTTSTNLENLIVTNLSTDEMVTYTVRIDFTGAPVSTVVTENLLIDAFANITLGTETQPQTGTLTLSNTTIEIHFFNPAGDGLASGTLEAPDPTRLPAGYSFSPYSNDFVDPSGIGATTQTVSNLTISEVDVNGVPFVPTNSQAYAVTIVYKEPTLEAMDITAMFGSVEGTVQIDETNITITGLNNYHDHFVDSNSSNLEFSIVITDTTPTPEFTVTTLLDTNTLTNGDGDLDGTDATTDISLGTFTITLSAGLVIEYSVSVRFGGPFELRVSGEIDIPSGTYNTIFEGDPTASITANPCSEVLPTFVVAANGAEATGYTVGDIDASLPYVLDRATSTNTKDATLDVLMGSDVAGTFSFDYIVSCEALDLAGMGLSTDPYQISSASELALVSHLVGTTSTPYRSAHYVLTADIDLGVAGAPWAETTGGPGFNPIGGTFNGNFDCQSNTISGLFINRGSAGYVGLIGFLGSNGTVNNCNLVDVNVTGGNHVGGLVGYSYGTISASSTTGDVTGGNRVGGLVGYSDGTISDSYATGDVTGSGSNVGGLVGWTDGTISDSYATGDVTGSGSSVGGLVGDNLYNGHISNSYATGDVTGLSDFVGGLVGWNVDGTISDSYATGAVEGSSNNVGGLVGGNLGNIMGSMATGAVRGSNYVGGLIGQVGGGIITNVYSRGAVSISSTETSSGGLIGGMEFIPEYPGEPVMPFTASIANSYTVSTGAVRSFVGEISSGATLTVTHSYTLTGNSLGFTPTASDSLSGQSRDALKMPTDKGTSATDLYFDWETTVWDFGAATELPILRGLPGNLTQATD